MSLEARQAVGGCFVVEIDDGQKVRRLLARNMVTDAGLNSVLDVYFRAQTQLTAWYVGLISGTGSTGLAATDTMGSHAGWTEATGYSESTRQQWSPPAASSGVVLNTSPLTFTANATGTIRGVFLASNSTKGGTTGTLHSHALFDEGPQALVSGNVVRVYYQAVLARR
jgi:hypothetical protein